MSISWRLAGAAMFGLAMSVTAACGAALAQTQTTNLMAQTPALTAPTQALPAQGTAISAQAQSLTGQGQIPVNQVAPPQYTAPPVQYVPPAVTQSAPMSAGGQPLDYPPRTVPGASGPAPGAYNPTQNAPETAIGSGGIIVTTTPGIDGFHVHRYLGVVRGVRVFQPTIGESFRASFKGIIGGNIGAYVDMCEKARQQAYDQLLERCTALGANAVLGFRYDSSAFSLNASEMGTEVICYGTAVYVEPNR